MRTLGEREGRDTVPVISQTRGMWVSPGIVALECRAEVCRGNGDLKCSADTRAIQHALYIHEQTSRPLRCLILSHTQDVQRSLRFPITERRTTLHAAAGFHLVVGAESCHD